MESIDNNGKADKEKAGKPSIYNFCNATTNTFKDSLGIYRSPDVVFMGEQNNVFYPGLATAPKVITDHTIIANPSIIVEPHSSDRVFIKANQTEPFAYNSSLVVSQNEKSPYGLSTMVPNDRYVVGINQTYLAGHTITDELAAETSDRFGTSTTISLFNRSNMLDPRSGLTALQQPSLITPANLLQEPCSHFGDSKIGMNNLVHPQNLIQDDGSSLLVGPIGTKGMLEGRGLQLEVPNIYQQSFYSPAIVHPEDPQSKIHEELAEHTKRINELESQLAERDLKIQQLQEQLKATIQKGQRKTSRKRTSPRIEERINSVEEMLVDHEERIQENEKVSRWVTRRLEDRKAGKDDEEI